MIKFKDIKKSPFVSNAMTLTTGTAVAQAIPLLLYPFLGRLYAPEQFALLAAYTSFVSILVAFFSGRYENAIFIANTEKEAVALVYLSSLLPIVFLVILWPCLLIFEYEVGEYLGLNSLKGWIGICLLVSVFITVFNIYNEWCVRKESFKRLSYNKITNSLGVSLGKVCFYYSFLSKIGLVVGDSVGRFLTAVACIIRFFKYDKQSFCRVHIEDLICVAKKYKEFPLFNMPAQLINTIGVSVPIFILGYFYDAEKVGFYSMTMTVLMLPVNIISLSIRDVFRKKANDIYIVEGNYNQFFKKMLIMLSCISIVIAIICFPLLPWGFKMVLGNQWYASGVYAQYLTPMILLDFVAMSLSGSLLVSRKLKINFIWQVYYLLITIISLFIGAYLFESIETTILMFSIGRSTAYIFLILISYKASKVS